MTPPVWGSWNLGHLLGQCLETVTQSYPLRPARLLDRLGGSFEPWGFSTLLMRFPSRFGFVNLFETRVVVWLGLTTEFESFPAVHPSLVSTFLFVLHRSRCRQWRSNPSWCHVVRCPPRWAMAATAVWRCPQGAAPDHWRLVAYWPWAQPWVQRLGWCRAGRAGRAGAGKRWSETCWRRWWKCSKWQMLDCIEAILDVLLRLSNFGMGSTLGGWNLDCLLPKMACVSHLQGCWEGLGPHKLQPSPLDADGIGWLELGPPGWVGWCFRIMRFFF